MTVKTTKLPTLTWVDVHEFMNETGRRSEFDEGLWVLLTNNTHIRKTTDDDGEQAIVVRLHNSDILTLNEDGTLVIDCHEYHTQTTRQRIDAMTTGLVRTLKMLTNEARLELTDYNGTLHDDSNGCIVLTADDMRTNPAKPAGWAAA